jgi:hypothetical protein
MKKVPTLFAVVLLKMTCYKSGREKKIKVQEQHLPRFTFICGGYYSIKLMYITHAHLVFAQSPFKHPFPPPFPWKTWRVFLPHNNFNVKKN